LPAAASQRPLLSPLGAPARKLLAMKRANGVMSPSELAEFSAFMYSSRRSRRRNVRG
jgi:hypothetical protein